MIQEVIFVPKSFILLNELKNTIAIKPTYNTNNYFWFKNNYAMYVKKVLTSVLCNLRSFSTGSGS